MNKYPLEGEDSGELCGKDAERILEFLKRELCLDRGDRVIVVVFTLCLLLDSIRERHGFGQAVATADDVHTTLLKSLQKAEAYTRGDTLD